MSFCASKWSIYSRSYGELWIHGMDGFKEEQLGVQKEKLTFSLGFTSYRSCCLQDIRNSI